MTFTAGGESCTAKTNASGVAYPCETNKAALLSGYAVSYVGDSDYLESSAGTLPLIDLAPPPPLAG